MSDKIICNYCQAVRADMCTCEWKVPFKLTTKNGSNEKPEVRTYLDKLEDMIDAHLDTARVTAKVTHPIEKTITGLARIVMLEVAMLGLMCGKIIYTIEVDNE